MNVAELDASARSIQTLYTSYSKGSLLVNRRYQRKLVWTLEEKQKLIESVLKGYPIPAILLVELDNGATEVIDGLQRLHTIMSFVETAFPTADGRVFDIEQFSQANTRFNDGRFEFDETVDRITSDEVNAFLAYNLSTSTMRRASMTEIDDVFSRINTYGRRLSNQERRQAGQQTEFANLVRDVAAGIRGDSTSALLALDKMPEISIDLPKSKHGYSVKAENTPWVQYGVLRSTDLRDGLDEECIADIIASIVGGRTLDRSKDALDAIYDQDREESVRNSAALTGYGALKARQEVEHTILEIWKMCDEEPSVRLNDLLFERSNNNSITLIFSTLVIALHESLFQDNKTISDYKGLCESLRRLNDRLQTSAGATPGPQRDENVKVIKGLIENKLIENLQGARLSGQSIIDIETHIRRSSIELSCYELKQGMLSLDESRSLNEDVFTKVVKTLCAIANTPRDDSAITGRILVGVADNEDHAARIYDLDGTDARLVGSRHVVGVSREARLLKKSLEEYVSMWATAIRKSELSSPLKESVLEAIDFNDFYGLGVLVLSVPRQREMAWVGNGFAWRSHDSTKWSTDPKQAVDISSRFQ